MNPGSRAESPAERTRHQVCLIFCGTQGCWEPSEQRGSSPCKCFAHWIFAVTAETCGPGDVCMWTTDTER